MKVKIVVFIKAPRPGFVKTRLGASLGIEEACRAYQRMAQHFLDKLTKFPNVELCFTPHDASEEIKPFLISSKWTLRSQGEGDLGQRMSHAVNEALKSFDAVLIFGTDCPYIGLPDFEEALHALKSADVVLGPAVDGGYWMIGLKQAKDDLFSGIEWSTGQVLSQTLERVKELGLSCHLLRELEDVDDIESWKRCELKLPKAH